MILSDVMQLAICPGLSLLPDYMNTSSAAAMLLSIGLQESRFESRRQIGGPARGFYQFERDGGVKGVLNHGATCVIVSSLLDRLGYDHKAETSYMAIEHNDVLATVYARLLLWTLPERLAGPDEYDKSWNQYIDAWRPGKPHRGTWDDFYGQAWSFCYDYFHNNKQQNRFNIR